MKSIAAVIVLALATLAVAADQPTEAQLAAMAKQLELLEKQAERKREELSQVEAKIKEVRVKMGIEKAEDAPPEKPVVLKKAEDFLVKVPESAWKGDVGGIMANKIKPFIDAHAVGKRIEMTGKVLLVSAHSLTVDGRTAKRKAVEVRFTIATAVDGGQVASVATASAAGVPVDVAGTVRSIDLYPDNNVLFVTIHVNADVVR